MNIKQIVKLLKEDRKFSNEVFGITIVTSLLILVLVLQSIQSGGMYLVDKKGNVVGLKRSSMDQMEEYDLNLTIKKGNDISEKAIKINKQAVGKKKQEKESKEEANRLELEAELNGLISDIEMSEKRKIMLPTGLSDGSRLYWSVRDVPSSGFVMIPCMYILLIVLLIKSKLDNSKKDEVYARDEIMKGLPRFTNQLMLMMNAGMILSDAFEKIADSYKILGWEKMGFWEKSIVKLAEDNRDHRVSTATVISRFAAENNVKELARISTVLTENEKRGSDIIDNLSREGKYLWDDRKIVAREKGKLIDTRMSYPMALLLILLIVITMAPAILNM